MAHLTLEERKKRAANGKWKQEGKNNPRFSTQGKNNHIVRKGKAKTKALASARKPQHDGTYRRKSYSTLYIKVNGKYIPFDAPSKPVSDDTIHHYGSDGQELSTSLSERETESRNLIVYQLIDGQYEKSGELNFNTNRPQENSPEFEKWIKSGEYVSNSRNM